MAKNKPPIPVKIDTPSLDDCIKTIRQALQRQQTYSESLDQTILNDAQQVFASKYRFKLPTAEELQKEIEEERRKIEEKDK